MTSCQLKLRLCKSQQRELERWLYHLASVYNFGVRKIELNARDKIYFSKFDFQNLLAKHSKKLDIPSHVLSGILRTVHDSWTKCFKKLAGKPRLKGIRNKMTSIPFNDPIARPCGNRVKLPGLGGLRFHKMDIPEGSIKCGRISKRASGWYLHLFIDGDSIPIARVGDGIIGIDPGFSRLLTTSEGEVIEHPREFEVGKFRLSQALRGRNKKLASRLHERIASRRKDRNHKLSYRLIAENVKIVFSKDRIDGIAKRFGRSTESSAHGQLRKMLSYKSPTSGTEYVEVDSKFSTMTCSECRSQSGPTGWTGLPVRQWVCSSCGATHDRDVNAAINTLIAGAGCAHEGRVVT